jgi:protoporphyrin/coproporphyrin ferrochelatase
MGYFRAGRTPTLTDGCKVGVLIVNLGTPRHPTYPAVWRYLREFLGDRRVIDAPRIMWWPVLYGFILSLRSFRTARNYRKIWTERGSPLAFYSHALTAKIAARLAQAYGDGVRVELSMTYGEPSVAGAIDRLLAQQARRILVLPLYPQYCSSTTGAVFDQVAKALQRLRWVPELRFVNDYYADTNYIGAIAQRIERMWREQGGRSHLLISFHGIPQVYVAQGDPYRMQVEATAAAIVARLGLAEQDWSLAYQSRFGPVLWLQPYVETTLRELAARGVREVTVVSPSFAVDCLETLEEIGVEYERSFAELGGKLRLVPALNDDDAHAEALVGVVQSNLPGWV